MTSDKSRDRLFLTTMLAGLALSVAPAMAQNQPETTDAKKPATTTEKAEDVIIVTGSRLARPDYTAISPVVSVSAEQIQLTATVSSETLLNSLPAIIPGNTFTSNNAGGENFPTVDLRGLGPQRTLVLINGERVPGSSTTGVVDIGSIPAGLINRIETVTGGTSVVYGSDAIAGAINFILKDDYEGAEIRASGGSAFDGAASNRQVDLLMGGNFDNGRGNITTYASWSTQAGVKQSHYDWSRTSGALVYGYDTATSKYTGVFLVDTAEEYLAYINGTKGPNEVRATLAGGGSATPPWGQITNSASNPFNAATLRTNALTSAQFAAYDKDCNPATANVGYTSGNLSFSDGGALQPYYSSGACAVPIRANGSSRYNFAPDNYIVIPSSRIGTQSFINYDVTESVHMKAMLSYSDRSSTTQLAPTPITGLSIPVNSPAISGADGILGTADDPHPDLSVALMSRPNPNANFTYAWRSKQLGPRIGDFENHSFLSRVSFVGQLPGNWEWSATFGYGKNDESQKLANNVNTVALLQGVQGCANIPVAARLTNCTNVDIFGPGALTKAAANYIRTDVQQRTVLEESNFSAYLRGDLFEMPAGPVSVVGGLEYRDSEVDSKVDDAQRRGEIAGFNAVQSIKGAIYVTEAYGEARVPILKEQPFAKSLDLELGYRTSDYNTVGSVSSYKYGLEYSPVGWITFRTIFNKATRAPSELEEFQNGNQGFPAYVDPCRQSNVSSKPGLQAFCTTSGKIGAGFVPTASYPGFAANNSQVQAFAFGAQALGIQLKPEDAETVTAGFVLQPDFIPLGHLRGTIDYYDIKLKNAIAGRGAQTILNSCYDNLGSTAQSAADCQQIVRDPATGQVTSVNTSLTNSLGITETSGIDFQADYRMDLDELFKGAPGRVTVNVLGTYVDKFVSGGIDVVGTTAAGIGGAVPEYKLVTTLQYGVGDWLFQARHLYIPGLLEASAGTGLGFETQDDDFSNLDLSARWDVSDRFQLTAVINDALDSSPPQTPAGFFDQANTDAAFYAPWVQGRTFSIGGRLTF